MPAGLLVLGLLAQCMPEAFRPQLPALVSGLGMCLSHNVRDVQLAALRAASLFIQVHMSSAIVVQGCGALLLYMFYHFYIKQLQCNAPATACDMCSRCLVCSQPRTLFSQVHMEFYRFLLSVHVTFQW